MALAAGMTPQAFYRSTIGEVVAVLQASARRRRDEEAMMVDALLRALGAAFGSSSNPFDGLTDIEQPIPISAERVKRLRFWRPPNGR